MAKPTQTAIEKRIVETLRSLGSQRTNHELIVREGTRLVLPAHMTIDEGISMLKEFKKDQEQLTQFSHTFRKRPWDGAAALSRALFLLFGTTGFGKVIRTMFGDIPPELRTIPTGPNGETMQVPWGMLHAPFLMHPEAEIYVTAVEDPEHGLLFALNVMAPKASADLVEGLFVLVQQELDENSIYLGKAIDGAGVPNFLNVDMIEANKIVYSDKAMADLDANVWSIIRNADRLAELGEPLKRTALLEGPYGTGKTSGLLLTAQIAVEHGWTVVHARPGQDDPFEALKTARLYQDDEESRGSVVLIEDIDTFADAGTSRDLAAKLLDEFDGFTSKGTRMLVVLTTNHAEKIHKGMVRPGRLDSVIHIGELDTGGVMRLIHAVVPEDMLDPDLTKDRDAIGKAMEGYLPAFVREAISRAVRYAVVREEKFGDNDGVPVRLTGQDFVSAADSLRDQLALMDEARDTIDTSPVEEILARITSDRVVSALDNTDLMRGDSKLGSLVVENGKKAVASLN